MDTDSIRQLVSILIWGGLFFVMMRFGCGKHMMGGRGHHGGHGDSAGADQESKDPVCGMAVDRKKSTAASRYLGRTYYFCSATCRDKFEGAPEKYASNAAAGEPAQGGHDHG